MEKIRIESNTRDQMIDITREVESIIREKKWQNGILFINTMHTTAGLTINENADPDVKSDMLMAFERIVPNLKFKHYEGNSDSHIKSTMTGNSVNIIINRGVPVLGIWQGIYFCEFDGPRSREVVLKFLEEN